ncbi:hypothetical protein NMY22_g951 [Coprinellus aureogranulatus]|nr:hypothetical protein NMY22_g951 [Coprinellus aureogranulatus]
MHSANEMAGTQDPEVTVSVSFEACLVSIAAFRHAVVRRQYHSPPHQGIYPDHRHTSKPRVLTMSAASSKPTTYLNTTGRGRFPCGRYHRQRILETSLRRSSLPVGRRSSLDCSRSTTSGTPDLVTSKSSSSLSSLAQSESSHPSLSSTHASYLPNLSVSGPPKIPAAPATSTRTGRLAGLRRLFSYSKGPQEETSLKPLVLPDRLGLKSTCTTSTIHNPSSTTVQPPEPMRPVKNHQRTPSAGWLPLPIPLSIPGLSSISSPPSLSSDSPPDQKPLSRLKPLKLTKRRESLSVIPAPGPNSERANMLAWLLDCIARDIKPHWSVVPWGDDERATDMVLHDGQARCLVVREKRRSALF